MVEKTITVRFFAIVANAPDDGPPVRLGTLPFEGLVSSLKSRSDGRYEFDALNSKHMIAPWQRVAPLGVAMHRLRGEDEVIGLLDRRSGEIFEQMAVTDEVAHMETSCVVFGDRMNVFGIVQRSPGSPTSSRVADWLNDIQPLDRQLHSQNPRRGL